MITAKVIENNATSVLKQTEKAEQTYEERVNELLDLVLEIQKEFDEISFPLKNLREQIQDFFNEQNDVELYKSIKGNLSEIIKRGKRLYTNCKKSDVYSAVKTSADNFKGEIDCLSEIIEWLDRRHYTYNNNPAVESLKEKLKNLNRKFSN